MSKPSLAGARRARLRSLAQFQRPVAVFHGLDVEALEFQQQEIIERQHGNGHAQTHDSGDQGLPDAGGQHHGVGRGVLRDGLKHANHAEHRAQKAKQGRHDGNEPQPAQALAHRFKVAMEQVAHFSPNIVGMARVRADDIAHDDDQRIVAVQVPQTTFALIPDFEEIPLKMSPHQHHVEKCAQGDVQARAAHQQKHTAGGANGRVDLRKIHQFFLCVPKRIAVIAQSRSWKPPVRDAPRKRIPEHSRRHGGSRGGAPPPEPQSKDQTS